MTPLLRENLEQVLKKQGIESDLFDTKAYWDSTLSYASNKKNILAILGKVELTKKKIEDLKEKAECLEKEREEEHANKEFNKAIDRIVQEGNPQVSQHYRNVIDYIKMVGQGHTNALILCGEGGLGKSHIALKTLKEENTEFEYQSGYITPLELVNLLYQHNGKLFFFDDCEGLFNDDKNLATLKSATWQVGDKRIVSYNSSTEKLSAPSKFSCNSRFIFCCNQLPSQNPSLEALINRTLYYKIHFPFKEKIKLFFEVAKQPYKKLAKQERLAVVQFLKEKCNEATDNLSIRTLLKGFDMLCYSKNDWKRLLSGILDKNEYLDFIMRTEHEKPLRQVEAFKERFGLSQATFYRKKKMLKERRGVI